MDHLAAIKQRQQHAWGTGDSTVIGASTVLVRALRCEAVALEAGHTVLDVATGSGHTALAAARRGAEVYAIDVISSPLSSASITPASR